MTKLAIAGVFISLMVSLGGCRQSAQATASATPTPDPCSVPVQELTVDQNGELPPNSPTLKNDLQCTEKEPNGGRFRMSIRFQRAAYHSNTRPDGLKLEGYAWIYPDVILSVNFVSFPKGMLTGESADKRAQQAEKIFDSLPGGRGNKKLAITDIQIDGRSGKQYEFQFGDRKLIVHSVFHDEDSTFYQIVANARTEGVESTVQNALDSFAFVTLSPMVARGQMVERPCRS